MVDFDDDYNGVNNYPNEDDLNNTEETDDQYPLDDEDVIDEDLGWDSDDENLISDIIY